MTVIMTVHWSFAVGVMDSRDARDPRSSTTSRPGRVIDVSVFTLAGKLMTNCVFCHNYTQMLLCYVTVSFNFHSICII